MTDTRIPLYEGSAVAGGRTIQVASGFADLVTDAWRQAGLRFSRQGTQHVRGVEAPLADNRPREHQGTGGVSKVGYSAPRRSGPAGEGVSAPQRFEQRLSFSTKLRSSAVSGWRCSSGLAWGVSNNRAVGLFIESSTRSEGSV